MEKSYTPTADDIKRVLERLADIRDRDMRSEPPYPGGPETVNQFIKLINGGDRRALEYLVELNKALK